MLKLVQAGLRRQGVNDWSNLVPEHAYTPKRSTEHTVTGLSARIPASWITL